jgi:hypothetical protein
MLRFLIKRMCGSTYYCGQITNSKSYTLSKSCTNGVMTLRDFAYPNTLQSYACGNMTLHSSTTERLLINLRDYLEVYGPINNITSLSKIIEELCNDRYKAFKELRLEKLFKP